MRLRTLVYTSVARPGLTEGALASILAVAREHNARVGITGALLFQLGLFIQVLEGPWWRIFWLMLRIRLDRRHGRVHVISRAWISQRRFGSWSMAYRTGASTQEAFDAEAADVLSAVVSVMAKS